MTNKAPKRNRSGNFAAQRKTINRTVGAVDMVLERAEKKQGLVLPVEGVALVAQTIRHLRAQVQVLGQLVDEYAAMDDEDGEEE